MGEGEGEGEDEGEGEGEAEAEGEGEGEGWENCCPLRESHTGTAFGGPSHGGAAQRSCSAAASPPRLAGDRPAPKRHTW